MATLIVVWGASPGIGKSTLAAALSAHLTGTGLRVDHFAEEEILTRPEFADVADRFRATGSVQALMLLTATARFVESTLAAACDVVIADALMPYIPSLLAMGFDDEAIDAFMTELTPILAPVAPVVVFLDGDAETALRRADEREGAGWLDNYIGKLAAYHVSPPVSDLRSAADYLRRERAVTLAALRTHDWALELIERCDELPPAQVLAAVKGHLGWVNPHPL